MTCVPAKLVEGTKVMNAESAVMAHHLPSLKNQRRRPQLPVGNDCNGMRFQTKSNVVSVADTISATIEPKTPQMTTLPFAATHYSSRLRFCSVKINIRYMFWMIITCSLFLSICWIQISIRHVVPSSKSQLADDLRQPQAVALRETVEHADIKLGAYYTNDSVNQANPIVQQRYLTSYDNLLEALKAANSLPNSHQNSFPDTASTMSNPSADSRSYATTRDNGPEQRGARQDMRASILQQPQQNNYHPQRYQSDPLHQLAELQSDLYKKLPTFELPVVQELSTNPHISRPNGRVSHPLQCPSLGKTVVENIVYYSETRPSDLAMTSSYRSREGIETRYLTFELNSARSERWNSRRRLLETMLVMAYATGRTLVLPPKLTIQAFAGRVPEEDTVPSSPWIGFDDILSMPPPNFSGVSIIHMDRFLESEGMTGRLKTTAEQTNYPAGVALSPPNGYTHWDGAANIGDLWQYLQLVSHQPHSWNPQLCVLGIPSSAKLSAAAAAAAAAHLSTSTTDEASFENPRVVVDNTMVDWMDQIWNRKHGRPPPNRLDYQGRPTPVQAAPIERLREAAAERQRMCPFQPEWQDAKVLHLRAVEQFEAVPFYSFVFFEDWKQDLFVKRLVRDQLRYRPETLCAAAHVVDHLIKRVSAAPSEAASLPGLGMTGAAAPVARELTTSSSSVYYGIHLRIADLVQGDAQFEEEDVNVAMSLLVADMKRWIPTNSTLYIATDMDPERSCFQILRQGRNFYYNLVFLSDIVHLLEGRVQPLYYSMVEQIVLARSEIFVGSYPSAFSAYVNRLRGYYFTAGTMSKNSTTAAGGETERVDHDGTLASYYFAPRAMQKEMQIYQALRQPLGDREYPVAWRDID